MDQTPEERSDDIVATEIGRAFLRAQRLADQIITDARRKAEQITHSPMTGGGRVDATSAQSAAVMLRELDEVEYQLTSSQREIKGLLDHYISTHVSPAETPVTPARPVAAPRFDPGSRQSGPTESPGTNGIAARLDQTILDVEQELSTEDKAASSTVTSEGWLDSLTNVDSNASSSDSAVLPDQSDTASSEGWIPGKTRVDPQWAAPVPQATLTEELTSASRLESAPIVEEPTEDGRGPRPRSSGYSGARANIITLILALAATSVALVLVNVL